MQDEELEVVLMVGLPASGKSTIAKINYPYHRFISLDEIGNHSRSVEEELIEQNLAKGNSVVVADTNLTREIRAKHIQIARKYNAHASAVFLNLPIDVILKRNGNREKPIPEASIFKMRNDLELPSYDEGFDQIRIISSPEDTVGRTPMKHVIDTDGASKKEGNFIAWVDYTAKEEFADRSQGKDIFRCEYLALIHALQNNKTLKLGDEIEIRCDNESVVKQLNGEYNINEEDIRWYVMLIHKIAKNFTKVSFIQIRSEENRAGKLLGK